MLDLTVSFTFDGSPDRHIVLARVEQRLFAIRHIDYEHDKVLATPVIYCAQNIYGGFCVAIAPRPIGFGMIHVLDKHRNLSFARIVHPHMKSLVIDFKTGDAFDKRSNYYAKIRQAFDSAEACRP